MVKPDESWAKFRQALREIPPKKLAEAIDDPEVTNFTTSNWKHGKSRPALELLPVISSALGKDPTYLAQTMGIIPKASTAAERIVHMNRRIGDLEKQLDEFDQHVADRRNKAVGQIVAEAAMTGRWAVGVWPALEGPPGFKFHVSDRLDFSRVDGGPVTYEALRKEAALDTLLSYAHAVHSPNVWPRWNAPADKDGSDVIRLSIPRLTSAFTPGTATAITNQGSVAVVALTVRSWAMDTAGFLARMLNYGFMSSRTLSTELHGFRTSGVSEEERSVRNEIHASMAVHPESRYVWGHYDLIGPETLFPNPTSWPKTLTWVWVRETDELLDGEAFDDRSDLRERCKAARAELDRFVESLGPHSRVIKVDASYPAPDDTTAGADGSCIRDWRTEQALSNAADAVEKMIAKKLIDRRTVESTVALMDPDQSSTGPSRSAIAHTIYRWLAKEQRLGAH